MKTSAFFAVVAVLAIVANSHAAKLVVMAVNSGDGTTAGAQPPTLPPGAKGFLIGIDNHADPIAALAFQDLTFSPTHLVQRLAPNSVAMGTLSSPNVQTQSQAITANSHDDPDGPGGTTFAADDSWWWNTPYTVGSTTLTLTQVSTGIQGGAPGGNMTMTASYNTLDVTPAGIWPIAYIVVTGDMLISGILAGGQTGFDLHTGSIVPNKTTPTQAYLDFETETFPSPEPSTFVLAGMAIGGFAIGGWIRRGKDGRLR